MPKSKTRYARAQARARYRKPKRRNSSMGWNVAIALIVVVGGLLIFFTVKANKDEEGVHPLPANAATGTSTSQRGGRAPTAPYQANNGSTGKAIEKHTQANAVGLSTAS